MDTNSIMNGLVKHHERDLSFVPDEIQRPEDLDDDEEEWNEAWDIDENDKDLDQVNPFSSGRDLELDAHLDTGGLDSLQAATGKSDISESTENDSDRA